MRVCIAFSLIVVFVGIVVGCGNSAGGSQSESSGSTTLSTASTTSSELLVTGPTREPSTTEPAKSNGGAIGQRFASRIEGLPLQAPTTTVGFGLNSLWLVDYGDYKCADTGADMGSVGGQASAGSCVAPEKVFLRRMDPETNEVSSATPLNGSEIADVAFGAGSAWIVVNYPAPSSGALFEMDSKTSETLARIPIASPSGVAFAEGSVWVVSGNRGTLLRLDPETGEATANIKVSGGGAGDVAVGDKVMWVANWGSPARPVGQDRFGGKKVVRVDPETNSVAAEAPVEQKAPEGGASSVAVDEQSGAVWATSVNGKLFRLAPETNRKVAEIKLGDYAWEVETFAGDAWVIYETGVYDPSETSTQRAARIDSATNQVIGSIEAKDASGLAAGRNALWLTISNMEKGTGALTRIVP